jgi:hypothetical protein
MTGTADSSLPVRPPLEMLRLAFPQYRILMQVIGDRLFYLAEAAEPGVQPRFAQSTTITRLRDKLAAPVRQFSVGEPSIPRVWDALLGGKDNFAIDREQASQLLSVFPQAAELASESREFQRRAVSHVASTGVRQFLDIGCGLPTVPNTHETAQAIEPGAAVVYVDNDEMVMSHAQSLLAQAPSVLAVAGDLSCPDEIMYDWRIRQVLSFHQPIGLVLTMTLHFFDLGTAQAITSHLIDRLPGGSYLIVSIGHLDGQAGEQFTAQYSPGHLHHHTRKDLVSFLDGLQLTDPGITEARAWRPAGPVSRNGRLGRIWAAVGRKASPAEQETA